MNILKIGLIFLIFISFGCKKKEKLNKSSIYSNQSYSDLKTNQTAIDVFFKENSIPDSIKTEVTKFYYNRNFQYAWFNKNGMTQAVPNFYNQLQSYSTDFDDNSFHHEQLDTLITLIKTNKSNLKVNEKNIQFLELLLKTTFFKYSKKVYNGINKNPYELDWFIPRNKKNYQILIDSLVISEKQNSNNEPINQYYNKLKLKLRIYRKIQQKGGFPVIKKPKKTLTINNSDSCLINVKKHLFLTNDLKTNDSSILFTEELFKAIILFQKRMGLQEDGKLGNNTLIELNQTVDFRIKQMIVNMERLRWIPVDMGNQFLLVNIPEFKLHVFENRTQIWSSKIVVGKDAKQTSIFKGNISRIILNPYWNVPNSIVNEEILPCLKKNPNYLNENNMEVLFEDKVINASNINWKKYSKNIPFMIRQKPVKDNALGKMKFLFPNNFNIYLHDTPSKNLFEATKRDFSHGCIRIENPLKLALFLIKNNKNWNYSKMESVLKTNDEIGIAIKPSMPVYITYFTSWVDFDGNLNFRNDLYKLDQELSNEIFAK